MDEVVGSAKVVLEGIDKISPAVRTSLDTLKKWGDSGADIQQKLIQSAQKHQQTIHALNQIYQQNQQAAKAAGTATAQGFQAGTQQVQQFTQAAGKVPPSLINIGQAATALQKQLAGFFSVYAIEEFVRKSYMAFTSHEEHMRRVQLAIGGSTEEIKKLHGELNDLAAKTGSTTEKMTDDFRNFMSRSGLGSGEAMQAFRGVVEAADEAGISVQDMSRIATAAMAQLKVSTHDMPQLLGSMGQAFAGLGSEAAKVMPDIMNSMQRIGLEGKDNLQGALAIIEVNRKMVGDAAAHAMQAEMKQLADPNSVTGRLVGDKVAGDRNTINLHMQFVDIERDILERAKGDFRRIAIDEEYFFGNDIQLQLTLRKDAEKKREDLLAEYQAQQKVLGGVREIDEAHRKFIDGSVAGTRALSQAFVDVMVSAGGFLDSLGATNTLHATVEDLRHIKEIIEWLEAHAGGADGVSTFWNLGAKTRQHFKNVLPNMFSLGQPAPPHMAAGGVVTEPTMTMIGEAGPEAVVPLTHGGDMRGSSGGTQAERDAASMWGRLHGHAMTRTAHVDRHGPLTQEVIDKLMGGGGGGGSAGGGGGGSSSITGGGGSSGGAGASGGATDKPSETGKPSEGPAETSGPGGAKFNPKGSAGVDPTLLAAVRAGAESLPEGYSVTVASGYRPGDPRLHGRHLAMDIQIFDPKGKKVQFYGQKAYSPDNADPTGLYTKVARFGYGYLLKNHPKDASKFGWGGSFPIPQTGAWQGHPDIMHYSLANERGRWKQNWPQTLGPIYPDEPKKDEPKKMAKGGVVTKPTLVQIGESGPEAVVPIKEVTKQFGGAESGGGEGEADIDLLPDQQRLQDIATVNKSVLQPGGRHRAAEWHAWLKQNPYGRGTAEGEGGPGGKDLFGQDTASSLKQIERSMEYQSQHPQEEYSYQFPHGTQASLTGGSSGGAGASASYPNFGGGFGGGSTTSTPPGLQFGSVAEARRALGVRSELTDIVKQAQQDNPDLPFTVAPQGGTRTQAEQDVLVRKGVSKTRQSFHIGGNAIDVVPLINGQMDWDSKEAQKAYADIDAAMYAAATKLKTPIGPEHEQLKSWDPGHYSMPPGPQTTAVTPLPKSRPAQASAQDHFNKNPIQVPVAPAKLGAHRQSFARSSGWAQRKATARRQTHEATVHSGEM